VQSSSEEKTKPYAISTDVKKLWKAGPFASSSGFGILARAGTPYFALSLARRPSGIVGPRTAAMSQRGIVSDWRVGASEK